MIFNQAPAERKVRQFTLSSDFLAEFQGKQPEFGPVGYFTYKRTYARTKPDGTTEEFWETLKRVVEGTFNIQKIHCRAMSLPWDEPKAQKSAQDMFRRMWDFKFLPPGRGLWIMGTDLVYEKGGAPLNNCSFVSTSDIDTDFADPFCFLMDMSMLGVGVGGDTRGAGKAKIQVPRFTDEPFVVEDSREGWVDLIRTLLKSFSGKGSYPTRIDYTKVRPRGTPLKGFGGTASGAQPLVKLVENVTRLLMPKGVEMTFHVDADASERILGETVVFSGSGESYRITSTHIVDLFNFIGCCVVAGGIRRTAEIMFGEPDDVEFIKLKQNQEALMDRRWASNNSIFARIGMDYSEVAESIAVNGEPGLLWMDNARAYSRMNGPPDHKDRLAMGGNPCVRGSTPILTRQGYLRIDSLVGRSVDVWNGEEWSTVEPRITGHDQPMVRVSLSDGTSLDCTEAHKWCVVSGKKRGGEDRVSARDLQVGDLLVKYEMPLVEGGTDMAHAYEHGFFCGDGQVSQSGSRGALLYGEKQKLATYFEAGGHKVGEVDGYGRRWVGFPKTLPEKFVVPGVDTELPSVPSRLAWFAGLLDADGTILHNPNSVCVQLGSIDREFLLRVRMMLTTLGVQAKVTKSADAGLRWMPDGNGGYAEYPCSEAYRLLVNATDTYRLASLGMPCRRLKLETQRPQRDARRFVGVESISPIGVEATVYCFTEHKNNTGTFAGIVTGQCLEQTLHNRELCTLVETFPYKHDSYEDYEKTLKMAYLYAKTVTLVPTHDPRTNAVMARNRRIGCSMSGITQAIAKLGRRHFLNWCDKGYEYVQSVDRTYSDWLGIPLSVKTTSVKPSGTISLLVGASPGIHYPHSEYYIRNIRVSNTSELKKIAEDAGYLVEPDVYAADTSVVSFPIHERHFLKGKNQVTIWEQFANAADLQRHWADNQVSITITFKPEEKADIKTCLETYEDQLKGVSLLPLMDHAYQQAPYIEITKERYEELSAQIRPMRLGGNTHEEEDAFCTNDSCTIRRPDAPS